MIIDDRLRGLLTGRGFISEAKLDALISEVQKDPYTLRTMLELLSHEAIVLEAYKDSVGVWTWGAGVTNKSGHQVYPRYKDNRQPVSRVLDILVWLCRTHYGPQVFKAFDGRVLAEHEFAAALSFHYNTGAIERAQWVRTWLSGNTKRARAEFMNWRKPPEIIGRRTKERDLFFDGVWTFDGKTNVYPVVNKPSFSPRWSSVQRVDIRAEIQASLNKR